MPPSTAMYLTDGKIPTTSEACVLLNSWRDERALKLKAWTVVSRSSTLSRLLSMFHLDATVSLQVFDVTIGFFHFGSRIATEGDCFFPHRAFDVV